eukprot:5638264-Pleurochrysis_carterae.AAC.5
MSSPPEAAPTRASSPANARARMLARAAVACTPGQHSATRLHKAGSLPYPQEPTIDKGWGSLLRPRIAAAPAAGQRSFHAPSDTGRRGLAACTGRM